MEPLEDRNLLSVAAPLGPVCASATANPDAALMAAGSAATSDAASPTVTINYSGDPQKPTSASSINFSVVFSEPVTGFSGSGVTLGGTAPGALAATVTGSGTTYNVAVSGMTGDGTVSASIPAGVAIDGTGDQNLASTSTNNVATYWAPPLIADVVVAEAGPLKNSTLDSSDALKITWAASSQYGPIAGQILSVDDGHPFSAIGGPYGGLYYSCQIGTLTAGQHTYTIQATDSRTTGTFTGSFDVAPFGLDPVISHVVVAEATAPRNGLLEANEKLVVTWEATAVNRIASQMLEIDGSPVVPINGPYDGLFYSCQIGTRGVGSHTYKITVTDSEGNTSSTTGSFTVVAPAPPTITGVVVAEATGPRNGVLETDEKLVITWAATSPLRIASQTLSIDGSAITPINGPYGGMFYSCQIGTWTAGPHTYVITSTDSEGDESSVTGTFTVVQTPVIAPTIADVIVAEASAPKDGILDSNDALKITWAASSPNHIASQTVEVDGSEITPINGPYGGLFYSCPIGKCGIGSHSYKITATDAKGVSSTAAGTFAVVAPASPTIADVVVADSGTGQAGALKITWSATSPYGIASQTLMVDGTKITPIQGPFGGRYYSCQIGTWPAGNHDYTITSTDSLGDSSTFTGTFQIYSPGEMSLLNTDGTMSIGGALVPTTIGATTVNIGTLNLNRGTLVIDGGAGTTSGSVTSGCVVYTGGASGTNAPVSVGTLTIDGSGSGSVTVIPVNFGTLTLTGSTSVVQINGTLCLNNLNNVAVVENGTSTNGVPEANEPLAVTWSLPNSNTIAAQTVTVDGQSFTPVVGDGNGNYRCDIGGWAPGQHTITIQVDHGDGAEVLASTFTVPTALTVDASTLPVTPADLITDSQLAAIVTAAEQRWTAPGSSQVANALTGINFKVANLAPGILAERWQNTIWIDDAAGYGWFVDSTPGDDAEFAPVAGTSSLAAPAGTAAAQRADLLTAVMHEIDDVLGNSDTSADDLMNAILPLGTRRLPDNPV